MAFLFLFTIFTVVFDVKTTAPAVVVATGVTADTYLTISEVIFCSTTLCGGHFPCTTNARNYATALCDDATVPQ